MNYSQLIHRTDRNLVYEGMDIIKRNHLVNHEFLPDANPFKFNSQSAAKEHMNRNRLVSNDDLKVFLATSVISHCFDGWMYLSHAIDSLLKGDKGIAIHLSYYAELRATLSFLASQGVSVHNGRSLGINNSGILTTNKTDGTHIAAREFLDVWINSQSLDKTNLLNYFTVNGKTLNEWVGHVPISKNLASQYLIPWLKEWSFDINNYESDHDHRNIVSYQPQRLTDNTQINYKNKFKGVDDIWKLIEPNGTDKFALLDKFLFKKLFEKIYTNPGISRTGISFENFIKQTYQTAGLNIDPSINSIIRNPNNHPILTYAKDLAIRNNSKHLMPLNVISRALLMLRISSGCALDLMNSANLNKAQIDFYLNPMGNNVGYWQGSTPSNLEDLWADISDSIIFIEDLLQEDDDVVLYDLYETFPAELNFFKQISRASFWGTCV